MHTDTEMTLDEKFEQWEKERDERRENAVWPRYRPEPEKHVNKTVVASGIGFLAGILVFILAWQLVSPVIQSALYGSEEAQIAAQYQAQAVTFSDDMAEYIRNASYYETETWKNAGVTEDGDQITVKPSTYKEYTALVTAVREEIDSLIESYEDDEDFFEFSSASVSDDYCTVTVQTSVKQESLIDTSAVTDLVYQLKIQGYLYYGETNPVSVTFVNNGTAVASVTL